MRQGNYVETVSCTCNTKFSPNYFLQFCAIDELGDRQSANGNNETGVQNSDFIIHPPRAIANLVRRWDAVGAGGIFTRETPADGGEIDL